MKKTRNIFIAIVMILIFLTTSGINIDNTFLCIGEDGHINIEYGSCSENDSFSNETHFKPGIYSDSFTDKCKNCNDIPLFSNNINILRNNNLNAAINFDSFSKANILYYPLKSSQPEPEPDNLAKLELNNNSYPKLPHINTSTTVMLI